MPAQFDSESHFAQWNEEMAHKYDPEAYHLRSNLLIRWIERRRVKAILRLLDTSQQDTVLEVGCGAGNVLEPVQSGRLYGIDLSAFLIEKSQSRLAHRQAKLVRANAERLPFADRQFRKLICTEVLEHVLHPRKVLSEMARVATADATLVISVPNERWINRVKEIIRALGLGRWLLQGGEDSYSSPDRMTDEWHLHSFDLALLEEMSRNILLICKTKAIPFRLIPLRYVACCQVMPLDNGATARHDSRNE
jgi:ubiquinone/menaquinone biosynthesis C-methylase UbiE